MAPLISRRDRPRASFRAIALHRNVSVGEAARWVDDAKLFAAGWVGGLVVFGTLFA